MHKIASLHGDGDGSFAKKEIRIGKIRTYIHTYIQIARGTDSVEIC